MKRNRTNFHQRNNGPSFNSSFYHPRDPFDIFKNFFGSFDNFHQTHQRQQNDNIFGRDPFENFFQNHSNLHRRFFNTPFHSAPNVFTFTPMFQKSNFDTTSSKTFTEPQADKQQEEKARKCSVETKTGQDGTVHITKTIIGEDGKVQREIRFRSPSANRNKEDDLFKNSAFKFRREQTEPSMKYTKKNDSKPPLKENRAAKENNLNSFITTKERRKSQLESEPMKTNFSAFYSSKDKENRSVSSSRSPSRQSSPTGSSVGSKKPPRVSVTKNVPGNRGYLRATESSYRCDHCPPYKLFSNNLHFSQENFPGGDRDRSQARVKKEQDLAIAPGDVQPVLQKLWKVKFVQVFTRRNLFKLQSISGL